MKQILVLAFLLSSSLGFAQTSSLYRNRIIQQSKAYLAEANRTCNRIADEKDNWRYFRGKYLNDCLQTFKMTLMKRHHTYLKRRIVLLNRKAIEQRSAAIKRDVVGLKQGLTAYQEKIRQAQKNYKSSCYEFRTLGETSGALKRHIEKLGMEFFELKAEMQAEGTL